MQLFRSILFFVFMLVTASVISIIVLPTVLLPLRLRYQIASSFARINMPALRLLCGLGWSIKGQENIPRENGFIILCKHQSAWETLALQIIFPEPVFVIKRELIWIPLFGWAMWVLNAIAIDRSSGRKAVKDIIDQGKKHLEAGHCVVVFPEGTRVAPGVKGRYGIGGGLLAESSGYPVIPVAHNAGEYWRRRGVIKYPGVVQVRIGPAITTKNKKASEIVRETEAWIEGQMADISPS